MDHWGGCADINPEGMVVHANATVNLPDDFYNTWLSIADDDLLAEKPLSLIQTLQAMLSFLKPGHGETVFASNVGTVQNHGVKSRL